MEKRTTRIKTGNKLFDVLNYSIMIFFCITILYPFWNMLRLSLAEGSTAKLMGFTLWNEAWTIDAYKFIFQNNDVVRAYANTIIITVSVTILTLIMTILGAYPLSKKDLPFRDIITLVFVIPMFFSGGLIPYFLLIKALGLYDNFLVLIVPEIFGFGNLIIMRTYLQAQDRSLEESAFMDGAGYFNILIKIVVPLMTPVMACIALWTAVGQWNAWWSAFILTRGQRIIVLQLLVRKMLWQNQIKSNELEIFNRTQFTRVMNESMQAATIMVTIGPILLAYPFFQKYFIKGIMIGALKG